jgi:hypothetical protein
VAFEPFVDDDHGLRSVQQSSFCRGQELACYSAGLTCFGDGQTLNVLHPNDHGAPAESSLIATGMLESAGVTKTVTSDALQRVITAFKPK